MKKKKNKNKNKNNYNFGNNGNEEEDEEDEDEDEETENEKNTTANYTLLDDKSSSGSGLSSLDGTDAGSGKSCGCKKQQCPACPACARCPEPSFSCKKVPNYQSSAVNDYLPAPILNDFSEF